MVFIGVRHKTPSNTLTAAASRFLRSLRAANSFAFFGLVFLATAEHASARNFLDLAEQTCELRKAYAVVVKLLAVYASHVLTIKLEPGLPTLKSISCYALAALLPSSSTSITIRDLLNRRSNFKELGRNGNPDHAKHYKNMQKAINAGAVCFRIEGDRVCSGLEVPAYLNVRAKPLKKGEVFIMVPRGTPAHLFAPMMIEGSSQLMKALLGAVQLAFATLQLLSAANSRVAAFGYGAFIYTIIPYAFGSIINLVGALLTNSHVDLSEMELVSETQDSNSIPRAERVEDRTPLAENEAYELADLQTDHPLASDGTDNDHRPPEAGAITDPANSFVEMKTHFYSDTFVTMKIAVLEVAVYLAIVGGITRFHSGISSRSQRGWFLSWAIVGTSYGAWLDIFDRRKVVSGLEDVKICKATDQGSRAKNNKRNQKEVKKGPVYDRFVNLILVYFVALTGAATIGGVVAMIQQYLHLIDC